MNRKPASKNVFVVVHAESITSHTTALSDSDGGNGFHSWNEKLSVALPMHVKSITFEVNCQTTTGVKNVGVVRLAVSEFIGGLVPDTFLQFLSYRLRTSNGHRNGIINFSVRVVVQPQTRKVCDQDVAIGIPCW